MSERFTGELWAAAAGTYERIRAHAFLEELATGELDRDAFRYYVIQDSHYLKEYARALSVVAAKAPGAAETTLFASHAANAIAVEQALHAGFLDDLGGVTMDPSPTTAAYTNFLLATCHGGSFGEAVAAVLPCYWIYAKVGEELIGTSTPDPLYARWIETYGGEEFQRIVDDVLEVTDRHAAGLGPAERAAMTARYVTASRYEWMFWDAAYHQQTWPIP